MQHTWQACVITDAFTGLMVALCDMIESYNRQSKVMQRSAVCCLHALQATARLPSNMLQSIAGGDVMSL